MFRFSVKKHYQKSSTSKYSSIFNKDEEMKNKPKILTFVGYYLPGYKAGGQLRTIANMVENLLG